MDGQTHGRTDDIGRCPTNVERLKSIATLYKVAQN